MQDNSTILVVEDTPINAKLVVKILQKQGYNVLLAETGQEALQMVDKHIIDLILLDVDLPDMIGFDVCKEILKQEIHRNTPILFLTADTANVVKGFEAGGVDYIFKPFNVVELTARLRTHLILRQTRKELSDTNKQLEEKVKERTKKLQSALNDLDNFFYRSSHDMKAPILRLKGISHLLRVSVHGIESHEAFTHLSTEIDKLLHLNLQLINIGNIRTKSVARVYVNLQRVVEKICQKYKGAKVNLNVHIPPHLHILTDEELLEMVIESLLKNALDHYSPAGQQEIKQITLEANEVRNQIEIHGKRLRSGVGYSSSR